MDASLFHGNLVESSRILYTPSNFAKTNLIHLQEIGSLTARQPHISKRKNLVSYLLFIVQSGSGTLEYAGQSQTLSAGDCVFLDCRKAYSHQSSPDLWSLKWAHFYGPNMNGIYDKYTERGGQPCFHPRDLTAYDRILEDLYAIASSGIYTRDMKIFEKLTTLLSLLMEDGWNPSANSRAAAGKRDLQPVKDYLDQHYFEKLSLDHLAEAFYINKFYLTRIFKEQFGLSVSQYLLSVRITHAKQLLRFSDLSIEKIGQECGINDPNYFSRMFKRVEGISPGEFRRMWQTPSTSPHVP